MTEEFDFGAHEKKEVNLTEFDGLCRAIFAQRSVVEAKELELKKETERLEELKTKALKILKDAGKEKFLVEGQGTLYIHNRYTVSTPKDPEERKKFFGYLRAKGVFEDLITVNHQTLNSFWKEEREASNNDPDFTIPGIGEPTLFQTVALRKS